MTRVSIAAPRPYEAVIENSLVARAGVHLREILGVARTATRPSRMFVVTVPPVRRKWGKKLMGSLSAAGFAAKLIEMPDGERHKKLATVEKLAAKLADLGADRDSVIVAFGGGVVSDVAGLLASLYMRGVDVVHIPTTVLAQLDASIGGKTGVNLPAGKNLLGTFHQPRAVLIDPAVLSTLPEREFRSGLYEALKCGVIGNPELFLCLEKLEVKALRRDPARIEWIITQAVKLKAEIVSADEREHGLRRVLNFGHTIGHALEAGSGYRQFFHGEAVACGMIAATLIAGVMDRIEPAIGRRIVAALLALGPLPKVTIRSQDVLKLLKTDKKTRSGVVHFVLPRDIGKVEIANDVPEEAVVRAVEELRQISRTMHLK